MEYGLQSAHDETLRRIHRGHDVACFESAVQMTADQGINICVHIILGLPGEDRSMMLETARYLSHLPIQGIKIHLLYVVEGTPLAEYYRGKDFNCLTRHEYVELVVDVIELLPANMVIQRLTGDPLSSELVAPEWAREKQVNLRCIQNAFQRRDTWQGRQFQTSIARK